MSVGAGVQRVRSRQMHPGWQGVQEGHGARGREGTDIGLRLGGEAPVLGRFRQRAAKMPPQPAPRASLPRATLTYALEGGLVTTMDARWVCVWSAKKARLSAHQRDGALLWPPTPERASGPSQQILLLGGGWGIAGASQGCCARSCEATSVTHTEARAWRSCSS